MTTKKQYSPDIKKAAVARIEAGETRAAVTADLHITSGMMGKWIKKFSGQKPAKRAYTKRVNGSHDTAPPANNVRDAILFLKHAKQEMYAQLQRGEIKAFSKVHLWTLEAHAALTGET